MPVTQVLFPELQVAIGNYGNVLLDALTGIVWFEDKQILRMAVEKFYGKQNPRIEITVDTVDGEVTAH